MASDLMLYASTIFPWSSVHNCIGNPCSICCPPPQNPFYTPQPYTVTYSSPYVLNDEDIDKIVDRVVEKIKAKLDGS